MYSKERLRHIRRLGCDDTTVAQYRKNVLSYCSVYNFCALLELYINSSRAEGLRAVSVAKKRKNASQHHIRKKTVPATRRRRAAVAPVNRRVANFHRRAFSSRLCAQGVMFFVLFFPSTFFFVIWRTNHR